MTRHLIAGAVCALTFLFASSSEAALTVNFDSGTAHSMSGFTGFGTTSADMVGLEVSVVFDSGAVDNQTWGTAGIATANWTITQGPGSTYSSPFRLTNLTNDPIVSFQMHGGFQDTVFDVTSVASTPGTANGRTLLEFGSTISFSQDVDVRYFDEVHLPGSAPVGDIYAGLEVNFENGITNQTFSFVTDTDTASSPLTPVVSAVPEPNTMIFGFVVAALYTRRNRRTNR